MTSLPQRLTDGEQTIFFQAGGEWCYLRTPAHYKNAASTGRGVPCVIQCHGSGGYVREGTGDWLDEAPKRLFVDALVAAGIAVAGSHGTGNHWGRPTAVVANGALFETLIAHARVDREQIGLWGGGLGGAVVWNAITGPLAWRVKAAVLQQAVISYESVIRNHKFKGPLLEAYGLPPDTPDDLAVATLAYNDPLYRTRLLAAEKAAAVSRFLPEVLFVYGDADENLLYSENPVALSRLLGDCGVPFAFQTFPGVGHATY